MRILLSGSCAIGHLRPRHHRRHPARRRDRRLRHPRLGRQARRARTSTTCCSSAPAMSRYPLEGYREQCDTDVVLGDRHASRPAAPRHPGDHRRHELRRAVRPAKEALGRGASEVGTSTTTGDGGMTPEERGQSKTSSTSTCRRRYGMNPDDLRTADAIEVVLGQGAKPGGGGMLLGQKITERVAGMRTLPAGHRPALAPAGTRTGPVPTTSRSRSASCARSPTGRRRSTSRSAPPAPTTT